MAENATSFYLSITSDFNQVYSIVLSNEHANETNTNAISKSVYLVQFVFIRRKKTEREREGREKNVNISLNHLPLQNGFLFGKSRYIHFVIERNVFFFCSYHTWTHLSFSFMLIIISNTRVHNSQHIINIR